MILKETKEQLKKLAADIKHNRIAFKHGQRTGDYSQMTTQGRGWGVECLSHKFRWEHLVYCMARGRTYEQCEPKVHDHNKLDLAELQKAVDALKAKIAAEVSVGAEAVCASAI
jgi:hypothetical protein